MSGKADKGENMNAGLSAENSAGKRDCFARSDSAARKLAEQESANRDFESRDFDGHDFVERVLIENGLELPVPVESNSTVKSETVKSETVKSEAAEPEATESQTAEQAAQSGTESGSAAGPAAEPDSVSGASGRAPRLRVHGFTQPWQTMKFGDVFDWLKNNTLSRSELNYDGGIVRNVHYGDVLVKFGESVCVSEMVLPYITDVSKVERFGDSYLRDGDIVIADTAEDEMVGKCAEMQKCGDLKILSGLHTMPCRPKKEFGAGFLGCYLNSPSYRRQLRPLIQGIKVSSISKTSLKNTCMIVPPSLEEQRLVGRFFSGLDRIISVQERKTEALRQAKKYFLQNMFPRRGESAPRLRVHGFTQPWQTRKFGDTVTIERGGSPRPIDKFITDDENGLNWIKIGDAPEFGNYITHTSEKIIPEGLSKTRQVHPGDLILSNSMSFGKPYIMGINGCIHDGWLLIRDEEENYDLKFLCVLLGTESMLNQYKAMAAGSTVNNLNKQLVGGTVVSYPSVGEQRQIGMFFSGLDRIISVQERKTEALRQAKKYFLQNMFA